MAARRKPIINAAANFDVSGDVFPEPFSVKGANAISDRQVFIFNDTATDLEIAVGFEVPQDYIGTPKIVFRFGSTGTSGKIKMGFKYNAMASGEDGDPAAFTETATVNPTVPATALEDLESSIALTAANFAPGDRVEGVLYREGSDAANDTLSAAAIVYPETVAFEYADA